MIPQIQISLSIYISVPALIIFEELHAYCSLTTAKYAEQSLVHSHPFLVQGKLACQQLNVLSSAKCQHMLVISFFVASSCITVSRAVLKYYLVSYKRAML